jgi:protein-S-isoprenylcysteine O-methyltransferase Ste14
MLQVSPLQVAALVELVICWIAWSLAFAKPSKLAAGKEKVVRGPASRWGIFLVFCGFGAIWAYVRPVGFEKSWPSLVLSMILAPPSVALVWGATRQLGKQWRYEAALIEDHELIQTGPYRWIRHPIYASMLGMMIATGAAWTWWPMWIAGVILALIGTEIRVAAEDRLLAERFQESFRSYRAHVRAYIPFIR